MAGSLTDVAETAVLNDLFKTTNVYATPFKCALVTVIGTDSAAGTEVTGGSYARQNITFGTPSSGSVSNSADIVYTSMPATTVVGFDIWDSTGTPVRVAWATLTANKTTGSGDTLTIPAGSLTITLD
jgi:hypothetical protein